MNDTPRITNYEAPPDEWTKVVLYAYCEATGSKTFLDVKHKEWIDIASNLEDTGISKDKPMTWFKWDSLPNVVDTDSYLFEYS